MLAKGHDATKALDWRLTKIVRTFEWLEWAGVPPSQLGMSSERMDPSWRIGVFAVRNGYHAEMQANTE